MGAAGYLAEHTPKWLVIQELQDTYEDWEQRADVLGGSGLRHPRREVALELVLGKGAGEDKVLEKMQGCWSQP